MILGPEKRIGSHLYSVADPCIIILFKEGVKYLDHKDVKKEMRKHIKSSLKDLHLDESKKIGYTFKAMGAGFYGLRVGTDFRKTITELIMEGGDADRYVVGKTLE